MSRSAPRPLSLSLSALTSRIAPASTLARVQTLWEQAVGTAIATAARPVAEREGTLTISCEAAVWAQELDLMSEELTERLNAALGERAILELRCRTG